MQIIALTVKSGLLIFLLVLCYMLADKLPDFSEFNTDWANKQFGDNGFTAPVYFVLVTTGLLGLGFPRQAVAFLAGSLFGFVTGFLYAMVAALFSCAAVVIVAHALSGYFSNRLLNPKATRIKVFLEQDVLLKSVVIRLLPVGSNLLTNLAAGALGVKFWPFIIGSGIGYIPQMVIFALIGDGITLRSHTALLVSIILLVVSGLLSHFLFTRYRAGVHPSGSLH